MPNGLASGAKALWNRAKSLRPGLWLLPVATFSALYLYRPFVLGFYSDDWSSTLEASFHGSPFSLDRLDFSFTTFERPIHSIESYLGTSILGTSAIAWHFALIALVAVACVLLRRFLLALGAKPAAATVGVTLWLVFPWSLGYRAWPICMQLLLSLIFFLAGSTALLRQRLWPALSWYAASFLTYEAFYLQFLAILLMMAIAPETRRWALRRALPWFMGLQVAVVVFNRIASLYGEIHAKSFDPNFLAEFVRMIPRVPLTLAEGIAGSETLGLIVVELALLLLAFCVLRHKEKQTWARLSAVTLGFFLAILVLSLAGYALLPLGTHSRSFVAVDVWMTAFVALALCMPQSRRSRWVLGSLTALLFVALAFSTVVRVHAWQRVWEGENEVLGAVPIEKVEATDHGAVIVVRDLPAVSGLPVFDQSWAMSAAVYRWTPYGETVYRDFMPVRPDARVTWDGEWIIGTYGDRYIEADGTVWVWDWPTGTFEQVTTPGRLF